MVLNKIIDLIKPWQEFIGSLFGAIIAIWGAYLLDLNKDKNEIKKDKKRQYIYLLLTLHDLQLFITRCEAYLNFKNEEIISLNKITISNTNNYIQALQVFDLNPEVHNSIEKMYKIANIIKEHMDRSEVKQVFKQKRYKEKIKSSLNLDKDDFALQDRIIYVDVEDSILCNRYNVAISFIRHYLEQLYEKFNFVANEIRNLSKIDKSLRFPKTIKFYSKDYVEVKITDFKLAKGKLEDY